MVRMVHAAADVVVATPGPKQQVIYRSMCKDVCALCKGMVLLMCIEREVGKFFKAL